jgi:hypothetical protein
VTTPSGPPQPSAPSIVQITLSTPKNSVAYQTGETVTATVEYEPGVSVTEQEFTGTPLDTVSDLKGEPVTEQFYSQQADATEIEGSDTDNHTWEVSADQPETPNTVVLQTTW